MMTGRGFQPTRPLRGATPCSRAISRKFRFQPTRPLRGATAPPHRPTTAGAYFNPRAPCGARLGRPFCAAVLVDFNPRAPCGARRMRVRASVSSIEFQPTRPLRGATVLDLQIPRCEEISTHAPLAGRDQSTPRRWTSPSTFQPTRPLRGATTAAFLLPSSIRHFNPRAPCGARHSEQMPFLRRDISTHAPLAGRDPAASAAPSVPPNFNPRAPCGARLCTPNF